MSDRDDLIAELEAKLAENRRWLDEKRAKLVDAATVGERIKLRQSISFIETTVLRIEMKLERERGRS